VAPRAEVETEAKLDAPAVSVKPRATIEPIGVGPVGVLFPQPTAASPTTKHTPRLIVVSLSAYGNRIVLSV